MKKSVKIGLGVGLGALAAAGIAALAKYVMDDAESLGLKDLDENPEWCNPCDDGPSADEKDFMADESAAAQQAAEDMADAVAAVLDASDAAAEDEDLPEPEDEPEDEVVEDEVTDEDFVEDENVTGFDSEFEIFGSRLCSVDGEKREPAVPAPEEVRPISEQSPVIPEGADESKYDVFDGSVKN